MRFSLIVSTKDRVVELSRLFNSLVDQTRRDFHIVVVDQNRDDRLSAIINQYSNNLELLHIKSCEIGLSRGRNIGLLYASGSIIAWPDDDCFYPPELLECVSSLFDIHPEWDCLGGHLVDEYGIPHYPKRIEPAFQLNQLNLFDGPEEATVFVRRMVIEKVGKFDHRFGAGSGTQWGAGEGTDLMLRMIKNNFCLFRHPHILVHHPKSSIVDQSQVAKLYLYAKGIGAVWRKNELPLWMFTYFLSIFPYLSILSVVRGRFGQAAHLMRMFRGHIAGWMEYSAQNTTCNRSDYSTKV